MVDGGLVTEVGVAVVDMVEACSSAKRPSVTLTVTFIHERLVAASETGGSDVLDKDIVAVV